MSYHDFFKKLISVNFICKILSNFFNLVYRLESEVLKGIFMLYRLTQYRKRVVLKKYRILKDLLQ